MFDSIANMKNKIVTTILVYNVNEVLCCYESQNQLILILCTPNVKTCCPFLPLPFFPFPLVGAVFALEDRDGKESRLGKLLVSSTTNGDSKQLSVFGG